MKSTQVARIMTHVVLDVEQFALVSASLGGLHGVEEVIRHDRIPRLILVYFLPTKTTICRILFHIHRRGFNAQLIEHQEVFNV